MLVPDIRRRGPHRRLGLRPLCRRPVLTYKTSGIFNFAHGSAGAMAVFIFYFLHVNHGLAWPARRCLSHWVSSLRSQASSSNGGPVTGRRERGAESRGDRWPVSYRGRYRQHLVWEYVPRHSPATFLPAPSRWPEWFIGRDQLTMYCSA